MKKTYINPEMKVVTMSASVLQAASLEKNTTYMVGDNNVVLGRDWDDEEDDDF